MTELKKEFEEKFLPCRPYYQGKETVIYWSEVWAWIEQAIDEACKKQRHECALTYEDTIQKDQRYQETYYRILNAPSPLDEVK